MNPMSRSHAKLLVLRLCIFSILSVHLTPAVHAQAYTPNVTYDSASVFIEGTIQRPSLHSREDEDNSPDT